MARNLYKLDYTASVNYIAKSKAEAINRLKREVFGGLRGKPKVTILRPQK